MGALLTEMGSLLSGIPRPHFFGLGADPSKLMRDSISVAEMPPYALGGIFYFFLGCGVFVGYFFGSWEPFFKLPWPNHADEVISLVESSINQVSVLRKV